VPTLGASPSISVSPTASASTLPTVNGGIVHDLLSSATPEPTRIDWARVEAWLGTPLPTAYRDMADRFGSIFVGDWLWVHAPVRLAGYPSFDRELAGIRAGARDACDATGLPAPTFFPKRGGLLPFGSGRGGEGLFWDTSVADPDDWPVVVLAQARGAYGNAGWIHTGLTLVPCLEALMTTRVSAGPHSLGPLPARLAQAYGGVAASFWTPPDRAARNDPRRKALTAGRGLEALQVLVPPPAAPEPLVVDEGLPADYRALMEAYGPGTWGDWLRVWHPDDIRADARRQFIAAVTGMRDDDFLPFADSIDGDVLGWVREGPTDRWPLAWVPRHSDPGRAMPATFTAALLAWLRGTPIDDVFGASDPDVDLVEQATFEPYDDR
jgi:hypothetical protein